MPATYTFGRKQRLKSRKAIDALFLKGKSFTAFPLRVVYRLHTAETAPEPIKAGVSVSKKHFKKATDRNRIKRLLREAYRTSDKPVKNQVASQGLELHVFFIFTGKAVPSYIDVKLAMQAALQQLLNRLEHELDS